MKRVKKHSSPTQKKVHAAQDGVLRQRAGTRKPETSPVLMKALDTLLKESGPKTCGCGAPLATAPGIGEYCTAGFKCTEGSGLQKQEAGAQQMEYCAQFLGRADGVLPMVRVRVGKDRPGLHVMLLGPTESQQEDAFLRDLADLINERMNLSKYSGEGA